MTIEFLLCLVPPDLRDEFVSACHNDPLFYAMVGMCHRAPNNVPEHVMRLLMELKRFKDEAMQRERTRLDNATRLEIPLTLPEK